MVKAYLRYELTGSWGVIASATSNICYDRRYVLSTACHPPPPTLSF